MSAWYEYLSAVWAAARFRLQRHRHLPPPVAVHQPGSHCAHAAHIRRPVPPAPLRLVASDAKAGYCWLCGDTPCSCRTQGGDAA